MREAEGLDVAVLLLRIEDVVRRQFFGDSPASPDSKAFCELPFEIETRGEGGLLVLERTQDEYIFHTESGCNF